MKKLLRILPYLIFAALLPVMILRDYTPSNELRYLSIADEAIAEGHLFAFTYQGAAYADKPPLYLWIVMLGKWLFGAHRMWFLSLFSLLPALAILRTMDRWVQPRLDERTRLTGALMLTTCGLFLGLAVVLRMDMLMCLFITLALRSFWRIYTDTGDAVRERLFFPLFVFLALFTKGPVGVLVPLLSTVVFLVVRRKWRETGRYWGWRTWGILLAGCLLWFSAVWLEGGTEYLDNLLFHQTIDRAVDAFHHKEPFYYYLISMWYSLAPWSLLLAAVFIAAARQRVRPTELDRYFLTIILTTLAMLSLFSSKLAVYLAPAFPFFVYLALSFLPRIRTNGWIRAAAVLPALIWTVALPAVLLLSRNPEAAFLGNGWCIGAATILSLCGGGSSWLLLRRRTLYAPIDLLAGGLLAALFIGGFMLPEINVRIGYGDLCRRARQMAVETDASAYYVWGIRRPEAMDVYLEEDVREITTEEACAGQCTEGILMIDGSRLCRDEAMLRFVDEHETVAVGPYLVMKIPH